MRSPRYTILIANRNSGSVRRLTVARLPLMMAGAAILGVPLLFLLAGIGARQATRLELESLRTTNESLKVENDSYREATGELTDPDFVAASGARTTERAVAARPGDAAGDSATARADSLACDGRRRTARRRSRRQTEASTPQGTFGMLKDVLGVTRRAASRR